MTVADFLSLSRRSVRLLLVAVLLGLVCAGAYYAVAPRSYQASASGFVTGRGNAIISGEDPAVTRAKSYLVLINSRQVLDKIQNNPQVNPGGRPLAGQLTATLADGSNLIEVTATAPTPRGALALANGALTALSSVISDLEQQASGSTGQIKVIPMESAALPTAPSSPNWKLVFPAGAVAGLVVGYVIAIARRALDVRVRNADELSQLLGVGVLGLVPKHARRREPGIRDSDLHAKETLRQIRTGLRFASVDRTVRSIVVTSANPSEGKSTIAAGLAVAFAESGEPTVAVDADLRRPALSAALGVENGEGLSEVLSGQAEAGDALQASDLAELKVLTAGRRPPNPAEMLGSQAFRQLIKELSADHYVIIDAPPVLPVTDAALASALADGVVFVAVAGRTRKPEVVAAAKTLEQVRAHVLGVALNMVTRSQGGQYYYGRRNRYAKYYEKAAASAKAGAQHGRQDDAPADRETAPVVPAGARRGKDA